MTVVSDSSAPRSLSNDAGIRAQTSLGKRLPDQTSIGSPSSDLISLDDGVSSGEETWSTRLELHTIDDELHGECVTMLGDQRKRFAKVVKRLVSSLGVIVVGLGSVGRRE